MEGNSSVVFFSVSFCPLTSIRGRELLLALSLLSPELSLHGFRVAALSLARPRHGVLFELMTADTRRGTDTAKGSDIFTARRWCLGDDSSGKKLPGKEGREELLCEYSILLLFGEVGL